MAHLSTAQKTGISLIAFNSSRDYKKDGNKSLTEMEMKLKNLGPFPQ